MRNIKGYYIFIFGFTTVAVTHAQEGVGPNTTFVDKVFRVDTTKSYFIDITTQNIGTVTNWDPQFTKFIDVIDRSTGKRVTRIDVRAKLSEAGFKTINYNNHTRSLFFKCAANDRFVAFPAKDGGFIGVDIQTKAIIYNHKKKNDDIWPFWSNEDFFIATFVEKPDVYDGTSRTCYGIFNSNFKLVARIIYNLDLGKRKILKDEIVHFDRFDYSDRKLHSVNTIEINTNLLTSIQSLVANDYTVDRGDINIGKGLIKVHDEGVSIMKVKPYYTQEFAATQGEWKLEGGNLPDGNYQVRKSNYFPEGTRFKLTNEKIETYILPGSNSKIVDLPTSEKVKFTITGDELKDEVCFSKFSGHLIYGNINDGDYEIGRSDYWEVGKVFSMVNKKIEIVPPTMKVTETPAQLTYKYQGFNYSYGGEKGLQTYGLEISFYK